MLGLNRQEQKFVLFFLFTMIIGFGVKVYKNVADPPIDKQWQSKQRIIASFQEKSTIVDTTTVPKDLPELEKKDLIAKININTANRQQLELLPRIGPSLAKRIIAFRNQNGAFTNINEIKKVKGIGEKTFILIKSQITVE